jgi:hypothetical protein
MREPAATDRTSKVLNAKTVRIVASIVVTITLGSMALLLWLFRGEKAPVLLDVIRTAASIGVGTGGGAALWLAVRRQRSTEEANALQAQIAEDTKAHQARVAEDSRFDATERRITDLQTNAGEQLGSEKAAVRLNGLYALERLAQGNKEHRQAIVNVICAYLRMPYVHPEQIPDQDDENRRASSEELQVRLTAQRILAEHLRPSEIKEAEPFGNTKNKHWNDVKLDFTGATLVDLDMSGCLLWSTKIPRGKLRRGI